LSLPTKRSETTQKEKANKNKSYEKKLICQRQGKFLKQLEPERTYKESILYLQEKSPFLTAHKAKWRARKNNH